MISVAMAVYNGGKYIIKQLDSIKNQTLKVDEVIMTDDGSTDGTVELVEKYISDNNLSNWKIIRNEVNLRFSKNFFKAVDLTQGDYVFLADQDDIWREDKVELMIKEFEKDSELMALSTSCTIIDGNDIDISNKTNVRFPSNTDGSLDNHSIEELAFTSFVRGCTMCIRREVANAEHDMAVDLYLGHDWFYNLVAAIIGTNKTLNVPVFKYRVHGENASLGRRNRKSALAADRTKKYNTIKQTADAHIYIMNQFSENLNDEDKKFVQKMIDFYYDRLKQYDSKSVIKFLFFVLKNKNSYISIGNSKASAKHEILSDFMYIFNINFRIKR